MKHFWTLAAVTAALSVRVAGAAALAPTGAVTGVSVVPAAGRADVVVTVDNSVAAHDFRMTNPDRIVVDLSRATLVTGPDAYDRVVRGGIVNVRSAQYRADVVRIVITLDAHRTYTLIRDAGTVRVAINAPSDAGFAAWHSGLGAAGPDAGSLAAASARPAAPKDVVMTDKPVVLASAAGAIAPAIAPEPAPAAPAPATPAAIVAPARLFQQTTQSTQPRITVTYQDADIRDVLAAFAAFSGRTIVVGRDVQGTVTAEVRDQPWDIALQSILEAQGLAGNEDQYGIITVDSFRNLLSKRASEPLTTELVSINYVKASSLVEMAKSLLWRDCGFQGAGSGSSVVNTTPGPGSASIQSATCPTRGNVVADTATNKLVITDAASHIQSVLNYLHALDVRTPQVSIKAKIIFIDRTHVNQLGLSYDFGDNGTFFNSLVQRTNPQTNSPYDPTVTVVNLGGDALAGVSNAARPYAQNAALNLLYTAAIGRFSITSFLDATSSLSISDVQAEPSVVTLNNREAQIQVGEETPIRVIDASSAATGGAAVATVTFKETGIILNVTPHITNDGQILLQLHAEQSQLQNVGGDLGYNFFKRAADTKLLVSDGETAVIGGLTETTVTKNRNSIPILGELPLIGNLFSQTNSQDEKQDLLILITPHVLHETDAVRK
jgi:type IV pilus assembly protein PilQ